LKTVLITGGCGFLGKHVVEAFRKKGWLTSTFPHNHTFDLMERENVNQMMNNLKPDVVVHLAAAVGGIGANAANPGRFFYENIIMGAEVMHSAWAHGVKKYVQIGTSCSYPDQAPSPIREEMLFKGAPNPVTGPYGVAKLALITMAQAYRQQYGFNAITLIPANLYGPGDSFDPEKAHVIPALIMKTEQAMKEDAPVVVWGSGNAYREFLYVEDCAKAIVMATEQYDKPEPVNLGVGTTVSIRWVAETIATLMGHEVGIIWDPTKPDGNLTRFFDVTKAWNEFGFKAYTLLYDGIKKTLEYYYNEKPHCCSQRMPS
jgi:GDP-L-fucose synthase